MEKIIDDYESRRKAEEIYSRRNSSYIENKKRFFSIYKFLFQLLVLLNLGLCFVVYSNKNYIFNSEFLNQVDEFFNINVVKRINTFFEIEESHDSENLNQIKEKNSNIENIDINNVENVSIDKLNESDDIIKKIKASYSFIKPVNGTITSFFGNRKLINKSTNDFHTGIDISAIQGTEIISANSGQVIFVSSEGNYGNHLKIKNNEIITLYAHCNKIFVKEGDNIELGQKIAEVGNTGNSTGPHLHFEIRYNNEFMNPCDFLMF